MTLTELTENLNTIQSLADNPALTAAQLKAAFDDAANKIKQYINSTLLPELNTAIENLESEDSSVEESISSLSTTLTEAVGNITTLQSNVTALQTTVSGLKSGATTKITIGSSVPSSLQNGEVYFQYFN